MTGWNLPPGCSESDIPGNRAIDVAWDEWFDDPTNFVDHCANCDLFEECEMEKNDREYDCQYLNDMFETAYYEGWDGYDE